MMNEVRLLLKNQLLALFGFNKIRHTGDPGEKRKLTGFLVMMGTVALLLVGMMTLYSVGMAFVLEPAGLLDLVPGLMMAVASVLSLVTTVYKAPGLLFAFKDYDLLMSLPVRTGSLVASRLLMLYGVNLAFTLLTMVPTWVVYAVFAAPPWFYTLYFLLALLAIPLVPLIVAAVIGTFLALVSSRFKRSSLVNLLVSLALVCGVVVASTMAQTLVENFADIGQAVMDAVGRAYVLAPLFVRAVCRGDVGALALFLAVSAALFAGFCALTAWRFRRWNSRLTAGRASSGYRLRAMKTATPLAALFRKEWRRYMASPLYVMNTAIGMLLLLVASVALLVVGMDGLESALQIPDLRDGIGLALPLLLCFFIVMSNTAASAISLEGDHFQALKALPVTAKDIFRSKLLLGMLVTVPLTAVCAALLAVATRPGLPDLLLLFALPLAAAVFTPLFGLRVNLAYPHFTWKTETEVIKQSQATMIAVLGGMGLVGVAAGLTFGLQAFLPPVWTMTGVTLAFLAASALLYRNLMTKGAAKLYTL